ncbi:MAG TPA: dihydroorotate dehydrogenase (quinone) [Anaerolineales bacterium]|nr:dihydroorotate dehydrogenase (quinone) [Anaerolineales bacterium]
MYSLLRRALFKLEPEQAHALTLLALGAAGGVAPARWMLQLAYSAPARPVNAFGLTFRNPIGLAAGYDKDARAVRGLTALGFGHIEIGTVTPLPQRGHPGPRLFRLVEDEALINRLGFPSRGSAYVQQRMSPRLRGNWIAQVLGIPGRSSPAPDPRSLRLTTECILGINLGRNAATANDEAVMDYLALLQSFAPHADYLTINVSSPNTTGLRSLQEAAALEELLKQLHVQRRIEQERIKRRLPLLVKLGPDLTRDELDSALEAIVRTHMDGVIVTNTTVHREGLRSAVASEPGGLSGAPLRQRSEAVLQHVLQRVGQEMAVVSAGGVMSAEDARRRLDMGAALVQVYTGLIYRGPGLVREILKALPA